MIELERSMEHRCIIDKNVNSRDILAEFAQIMHQSHNGFDIDGIGDAVGICPITSGVRLLQASYYMFGYSYNAGTGRKIFMPSPMMMNILSTEDESIKAKNYLVNLFCIQYPNPINRTPACFEIYLGRLIVKLLLEPRIQQKLYIDECIWFLPFIEKLTPDVYDELIESILEYRRLSFGEKMRMIRSIPDYNHLFVNVTHEMNYYFLRLFEDFGVLDIFGDPSHNGGNLFSFKHGNTNTYRNDAFKSRKSYSGYVKLTPGVYGQAKKLCEHFSIYDCPTKESSEDIMSKRDWLTNVYEIEPLLYLNCLESRIDHRSEVSSIVTSMVHASKFGSRDGHDFENALKPFLYLFRETRNVDIISGAGNTDLLCTMEELPSERLYKMNVDAKTRGSALEEINPIRITNHIRRHGAEFCIVVAPRFASGVQGDIREFQIVTVRSEDLGAYCYRECMESRDGYADFSSLLTIIHENQGRDITSKVRDLTESRYGITLM